MAKNPVLKNYFVVLNYEKYIYYDTSLSFLPSFSIYSEKDEKLGYTEDVYDFENGTFQTFYTTAYTIEEAKFKIIKELKNRYIKYNIDEYNENKYDFALEGFSSIMNIYEGSNDEIIKETIINLTDNTKEQNLLINFIDIWYNIYYPKMNRLGNDCSKKDLVKINALEMNDLTESHKKIFLELSETTLLRLFEYSFYLNLIVFPIEEKI